MVQFYFLSIVANAFAGLILAGDYLSSRLKSLTIVKGIAEKKSVQFSVGIFALLVGFLKLLIRSVNTDVPVVGDLLPALAGMGMGVALLLQFFKESTQVPADTLGKLEQLVMQYRVPLGLGGLAVSLLHFILPAALFL